MIKTRIKIAHYRDYCDYLAAIYQEQKLIQQRYSYHQFSADLGFTRSGYLHLIIKKKRLLTQKAMQTIATALALNEKEGRHFKSMVDYLRAPGDEKGEILANLIKRGGKPGVRYLEKSQFRYFSRWYIPAVRELVQTKGFIEDLSWISQRLHITETKAKEALKVLLDLGLLKRNDRDRLIATSWAIQSPSDLQLDIIRTYHKQVLKTAAKAIDEVAMDQREVQALTMSIDRATAKEVKKRIQAFTQSLVDYIVETEQGSEVMQFNIQWYPLTRDDPDEKATR